MAATMSRFRNMGLTSVPVLVKAGTLRLRAYHLYNVGAAGVFIKFYDMPTSPSVGTDVPRLSLPVGAGQGANLYLGDQGYLFTSALYVAATVGGGDADAVSPAASEAIVHLFYS